MTNPVERKHLISIEGYIPGEQISSEGIIKLNTNENPYPPSPKIKQALSDLNFEILRKYPHPNAISLRETLAQFHQISKNKIVITNGGDEALRLILSTFVETEDLVGYLDPSYTLYETLTLLNNSQLYKIPLSEEWEIPENIINIIQDNKIKVFFITNPHAPSGKLFSLEFIEKILSETQALIVLDEAYIDFIENPSNFPSTQLLSTYENLFILRTFSKGYSLAGIRCGYLLAAEKTIQIIESKTKDSYNVNALTQIIAEIAIKDQKHFLNNIQLIQLQRNHLIQAFRKLSLSPYEQTQSNFILLSFPQLSASQTKNLYLSLKEANILVRYFSTPRLSKSLRITIGTEEQNTLLLEKLQKLLRSLS